MMKIQYRFDKQQHFVVQQQLYWHSVSTAPGFKYYRMTNYGVIALFVASVLSVVLYQKATVPILFLLLSTLIIVLFMALFPRWLGKLYQQQAFNDSNRLLHAQLSTQIAQDGIITSSDQMYTFTPYQYLRKVERQPKVLMIYTDSNTALAIPLTAFENEQQITEFQTLLQQKMQQSQDS